MKILAIEWGAKTRSVAVGDPSAGNLLQKEGGREDQLGPMARQALSDAGWTASQLDAVAVGIGPGSYTGIRSSIAFVQGWSLALGLPTLPIRSDLAVAWSYFQSTPNASSSIQIAAYAQREENAISSFHWDGKNLKEAGPIRLESVQTTQSRAHAGAEILGIDLDQRIPELTAATPQACVIARLAEAEGEPQAPESLEPVYLREVSFKKAPEPPDFLKKLLAE